MVCYQPPLISALLLSLFLARQIVYFVTAFDLFSYLVPGAKPASAQVSGEKN